MPATGRRRIVFSDLATLGITGLAWFFVRLDFSRP